MTTLKQGDLIKDQFGNVSKVREVYGTILYISYPHDHNKYDFTADEAGLKEDGYTWDTPAWEPELGKMYWYVYINAEGEVKDSIWDNDEVDHARRDFLGIYQTEELGKAALLEIRRKLGK